MAVPAFRAAGAAVFSANSVANPTALSPVKNAATVNGDLMLLIAESRSETTIPATPNGWTRLIALPGNAVKGGSIWVYSRIATGGAQDAPTISFSGLTTGTSGDSCGARIISWSGAQAVQDGTVPAATDTAATTSWTVPAITTTKGNTLVVAISVKISDTSQTATITNFTERSDDTTSTGTGHATLVGDLVITPPGSSGTGTVTPSSTTSSRVLAVTLGIAAVPVSATVGIVSETETAQTIQPKKIVAVGRVSETDAAQTASPRKAVALGFASEADSAQTIAPRKRLAIGLASETDSVIALLIRQEVAVGQAAETNLAQSLTPVKSSGAGLAIEADSAQSITILKAADLELPSEVDAAQPILSQKAVPLDAASETEIAQPITTRKLVAVGQAQESNSAQPVSAMKAVPVGQCSEAETALSLTARKVCPIGSASEINEALALTTPGSTPVGQAREANTSQPFSVLKTTAIGPASEVEVALSLVPLKQCTLNVAQESNAALAIIVRSGLAIAGEQDSALPIAAVIIVPPPPPDVLPDLAGFRAAMADQRDAVGADVEFYIEEARTYPPGTTLDPASGEPYDPTIGAIEEGDSVVVHCGVYMRPVPSSMRADVVAEAIGAIDQGAALIDIAPEDYDQSGLANATEAELFGERYEITDRDPDGIDLRHRVLVYVRKK